MVARVRFFSDCVSASSVLQCTEDPVVLIKARLGNYVILLFIKCVQLLLNLEVIFVFLFFSQKIQNCHHHHPTHLLLNQAVFHLL